jgi:hypothetical protein
LSTKSNFFEIGGNSLRAGLINSKIRRATGQDISGGPAAAAAAAAGANANSPAVLYVRPQQGASSVNKLPDCMTPSSITALFQGYVLYSSMAFTST